MSGNEEYNWLDDPFDEKKNARVEQAEGMSGRSKALVGIGCLAAIVAVVALGFAGFGLFGALIA